jgi:hypothetical protein
MVDPSNDPDELDRLLRDYDGDFDDPDDAEEWVRFCAEEGIEAKPFKFELMESIDGYCWLTGGLSTAHIHRCHLSTSRATVHQLLAKSQMRWRPWLGCMP